MQTAKKPTLADPGTPKISPAPGREQGKISQQLSNLPLVSTDVPIQTKVEDQTVLQQEPESTTTVEEVETPEVEQEEAIEDAFEAEEDAMEEEEEALDADQDAIKEAQKATKLATRI